MSVETKRIDELPDLVEVPETARYFGVAESTIRRMIQRGELVRVKAGRLDRVTRTSILAKVEGR